MRKIDTSRVKCQNKFSVASTVNDVAMDKSESISQCRFSVYLKVVLL